MTGIARAEDFAALFRLATAGLLIFFMTFLPGARSAAENRVRPFQEADPSSSEIDGSAPESFGGSKTGESVETYFRSGAWQVYGYGAAAAGKSRHKLYAGNLGLGYHPVDNLSVNLEAGGYFIDHARDTGGGGLDTLFRWHVLQGRDWSLYLDGGPGFIYTRKTLRSPGTHFNFTVQGGAGAAFDIGGPFLAMGGMRWFHISNARLRGKNRNVGFDSPMFYFGLMMSLPHRCKKARSVEAGKAYFLGRQGVSEGCASMTPEVNSGRQPFTSHRGPSQSNFNFSSGGQFMQR